MDFNSIDELKERVMPALNKRESDLKILGFNKNAEDIFIDLSKSWRNKKDLSLAEIVDDILKYIPKKGSDLNEEKNNKL